MSVGKRNAVIFERYVGWLPDLFVVKVVIEHINPAPEGSDVQPDRDANIALFITNVMKMTLKTICKTSVAFKLTEKAPVVPDLDSFFMQGNSGGDYLVANITGASHDTALDIMHFDNLESELQKVLGEQNYTAMETLKSPRKE